MSPINKASTSYSTLHPRAILINSDSDMDGSGWVWGRWILFVIFLICIIAVGLGTARINRRRRTLGQAPIRGTAWMTPPSYRQSQRQYNGPQRGVVEDYVPQYTETANEQDLGYYDAQGEFHLNSKTEMQPPPPLVRETASESSESLERPRAVVTRDSHSSDLDMDFRRYVPPRTDSAGGQPSTPGGFSSPTDIQMRNSESVEFQQISTPEKTKSPSGYS